jgi:hypothetical protein
MKHKVWQNARTKEVLFSSPSNEASAKLFSFLFVLVKMAGGGDKTQHATDLPPQFM